MSGSSKIIRSICLFQKTVSSTSVGRLKDLSARLGRAGFEVQTERIVTVSKNIQTLEETVNDSNLFLGLGSISLEEAQNLFDSFAKSKMVSFHMDLTEESITESSVDWLWQLMLNCPDKMFRFSCCFSNPPSAAYFPSARYEQDGFSIGLQPTDLAVDYQSIDEWLDAMKQTWIELIVLFQDMPDFLGIDSSIAPMGPDSGSLVGLVNRLSGGFESAILSETFLKMTRFIREENPKPVGLCGLMLPCLEDFLLADLYEAGQFPLERNLFLSLHSGLGIDTYPIGIDENKQSVLNILKLVQGLSHKYHKPLSIRFVSDGKAKIGEKTDLRSPYLKDVVVRAL